MRKYPGILVPACTFPDGIGNTSHQTKGCVASIGLWQSFQVLSSCRFRKHCVAGSGGGSLNTYFGTTLPLLFLTVTFGSNTSTIWNGLMWMWNGCEIDGP